MLDKNEKILEKVSWQLPIQGAMHLIWDMIITKAKKMRPYLNYIKDKEVVISVVRQSCIAIKETLDRKLADTTHNTIDFLNTLSEEELKTMGIKDMTAVINWARKIIGKHHHIESVQAKADQML